MVKDESGEDKAKGAGLGTEKAKNDLYSRESPVRID
jgi:hypothetical protein